MARQVPVQGPPVRRLLEAVYRQVIERLQQLGTALGIELDDGEQ